MVLTYLAAREILGNLVQYNKMDHESVPIKYNIIARNYTIIKLNGQTDEEILICGNKVIGKKPSGKKAWQIKFPYKLFIKTERLR